MYPQIKQTTNDYRTVIVQFDAPDEGCVLFCTDDEYQVGERCQWKEDVFDTPGLDNTKVRLVNGDIARLEFKEATKARGACYESICLTHRFDLQGRSTCRAKYNISKIEGLLSYPEYKDPKAEVDAALERVEEMVARRSM